VNIRYDMAKKLAHSNISGHTGPIFTIFSSYENAVRVDDESVPHFPIFQGTLPYMMMVFCSGVSLLGADSSDAVNAADSQSHGVTADSITADTVIGDSTVQESVTESIMPPVQMRHNPHRMAVAVDSELRPDSEDVCHHPFCLLTTFAWCSCD